MLLSNLRLFFFTKLSIELVVGQERIEFISLSCEDYCHFPNKEYFLGFLRKALIKLK